MKKKIHLILLIIILLSAFTIRIFDLDWGLREEVSYYSQIPDEPYSYSSAFNIKPLEGELEPGRWALIKGPGYYSFIGLLNDIFEKTNIKSLYFPPAHTLTESKIFHYNLLFARTITILFSVATILLIYLLSNILFKRKSIGLIAAATYSIIAMEVHLAKVFIPDIPLTFLTTLSLFFAIKASSSTQKKGNKLLIYSSLVCGLATAVKLTGVIAGVSILYAFIVLNRKAKVKEFISLTSKMAVVFLIGLVIGMPSLLFEPQEVIAAIMQQFQHQSYSVNSPQIPQIIFIFTNILLYSAGILLSLSFFIAPFYLFWKHRKKLEIRIILIFVIVSFVSLVMASPGRISEHYLLPLLPILTIVTALMLDRLIQKKKLIGGITISLFFIYNLLFLYNHLDLIRQEFVTDQFTEYAEKNLPDLYSDTPMITFFANWKDKVSYPATPEFPAYSMSLKQIGLEIPTDYFLISDINFIQEVKKKRNKEMIDFLNRLGSEEKYQAPKVFKKSDKLPYLVPKKDLFYEDSEPYYGPLMATVKQKLYLYKRK